MVIKGVVCILETELEPVTLLLNMCTSVMTHGRTPQHRKLECRLLDMDESSLTQDDKPLSRNEINL